MEQLVRNAVEKKVEEAFAAAVGSYQIKTIATDATVDILKDEEYVQKSGAKLLTNQHVLSSLNEDVTDTFAQKKPQNSRIKEPNTPLKQI